MSEVGSSAGTIENSSAGGRLEDGKKKIRVNLIDEPPTGADCTKMQNNAKESSGNLCCHKCKCKRSVADQATDLERQVRGMQHDMENLQRQLSSACMERESAIHENSRLQEELAAMSCEVRSMHKEIEAAKSESCDLKRQLQTYVSEVRRAEDLINQKENERTEMLNHFRSLSMEASVLESNNHSLETEAAEAKTALQTARDQVTDLERQLSDKDCLMREYETQINELSQNVASLEIQLQQAQDERERAEEDLRTVRDLCCSLENQKDRLHKQLDEALELKEQCEIQLSRYRSEQDIFQDQMNKDHKQIDCLEHLLEEARRETMNSQCNGREMQSEVTRLRQKISDLQNKLCNETSELRKYQTQAAEYSKQISDLRRQVNNERFDKAKKKDDRSSNCTVAWKDQQQKKSSSGRQEQSLQSRWCSFKEEKANASKAYATRSEQPMSRCSGNKPPRPRSGTSGHDSGGYRGPETSRPYQKPGSSNLRRVNEEQDSQLTSSSSCDRCGGWKKPTQCDEVSSPALVDETLKLLNKLVEERKRAREMQANCTEDIDELPENSDEPTPRGCCCGMARKEASTQVSKDKTTSTEERLSSAKKARKEACTQDKTTSTEERPNSAKKSRNEASTQDKTTSTEERPSSAKKSKNEASTQDKTTSTEERPISAKKSRNEASTQDRTSSKEDICTQTQEEPRCSVGSAGQLLSILEDIQKYAHSIQEQLTEDLCRREKSKETPRDQPSEDSQRLSCLEVPMTSTPRESSSSSCTSEDDSTQLPELPSKIETKAAEDRTKSKEAKEEEQNTSCRLKEQVDEVYSNVETIQDKIARLKKELYMDCEASKKTNSKKEGSDKK